MSVAEGFFDSNVILYLISGDIAKADTAETLIARGGHISVQVLNEFVAVARRKQRLAWPEIDEILGTVREVCRVHALDVESHDKARAIAERYGFSFYDSLIVASALGAGCTVLYTEDLQSDQRIDHTLLVRNPFIATGGRSAPV